MSLKNNLMTSAAALALITGAAIAQDNTATTDTDAPEYAVGWNEDLDQQYGDIADRQVAELVGMSVMSDQGDDVGEVDNFVIMEDQLRAVVGVGGFLGLGEHHVAIALDEMTFDGDNLVVSFTREELEAMPAYTEEVEAQRLAETDTFRERQMTEDGGTIETASADGETGGDMEATGDGSTEMAATQTVDADDSTMDVDAEQTAEADTMETVDPEAEADGNMTADMDPGTDEDASPTGEEVAAAEEATGDDPAVEEVAENEQGEIEQEAEELTAEAEATAEDAGDEMAEAADATENAVEGAATEAGEELAEAGEATENAAEDAGAEMAEAADATENAVEGAATEAGEEMAEAGEATENMAEDAGDEMAEAAENTENAVEGAAAETAAAADAAADEAGDWMAKFSDIADWQINEIEGKDVASADGNVIGEVDDLGRQNGELVALVGIGGFLGLGEHDVALSMENLSWDGEKFVTDGYTEEDLKAMSEYDAETVEMLDDDTTLQSAM